ncbi:MarR family winged helix-turn-helix transcriptional regulator [Nocardia sp. CDC160]|uniref:MarR family winged helix-turn-helix transcriptional regulator n=1 Tax=Nocardia sp. CDC160 TaxID=3112166 RepID=UPI002DB9AB43|nr:MarR family transcriptional regulator [Nocardia sp. CDC160]MEC3919165.1 MarR family transcriptional regulator [Nocardia sp. CDC160]
MSRLRANHDEPSETSTDTEEPQLGTLLKHAYRSFDGFVSAALAHHGIDRRELAVLRRIAADTWLSQQDAAAQLGIDRTTMVALLDSLERKELVQRRTHPHDRRKNVLAITEAGHHVLTAAAPTALDAERRFLQPLGSAATQQLKNALQLLTTIPEQRQAE